MLSFVERKRVAPNRESLVMGVGINDANYYTNTKVNGKTIMCPFYRAWNHMLERCYSEKYHSICPTYIDCSVCSEWLVFTAFKKWMITQDWKSKHLDKDILEIGNKIYSPNTCLFVSPEINGLMIDKKSFLGDLPQGVSRVKSTDRFRARCYANGKSNHIGYFRDVDSASEAYNKFKSAHVLSLSNEHPEPLKSALVRISEHFAKL